MYKHIALFKLKDSVDGKNKEKNIRQIIANVQAMKESIKTIKKIELGRHNNEIPFPAYDLAVYVEFLSFEDYQEYFNHPVHQKAAHFAASVAQDIAGITYDQSLV